jgi:catechol 2,3-dioxygenase-like lactoylglutathione lyase family enzyme
MSAKVHVHLQVADLGKSREFYEKFLGEGPIKVKSGYVKFLPGWAPVNLALSHGGQGGQGPIDHIGIQVDSPDTVMAQLARVKASGLPVREEIDVNCCHANHPDGVAWEVYHLNYDLADEEGPRQPGPGLQLAKGGTCCAS